MQAGQDDPAVFLFLFFWKTSSSCISKAKKATVNPDEHGSAMLVTTYGYEYHSSVTSIRICGIYIFNKGINLVKILWNIWRDLNPVRVKHPW